MSYDPKEASLGEAEAYKAGLAAGQQAATEHLGTLRLIANIAADLPYGSWIEKIARDAIAAAEART